MSDIEPIMRDHSDTSEEEQNELRKINQDNRADDTILGDVDNTVGSVTQPLRGDRQDVGDLADDATLNDRDQRSS